MLCVTGLPLIFHDEIDKALNPNQWTPANPGGALLDLDAVLKIALERRPNEVPIFMSFDVDRPVVNVTTGAAASVPGTQMHFASYDRTSGALVPPADVGAGVMDFLLQLHTDMFLGLPGMLFLGLMGLLFSTAIVSGVVLYQPFMRKLPFGSVRVDRSSRAKWLDYHNFLGVVTVAWALVVGLTGVINTLEQPIIGYWRQNALGDLIRQASDTSMPAASTASLDRAVGAAVAAAPGLELQFVAFPGSAFSTATHYAIFLHGRTPLTEHIITPALVHASDGRFDGLRQMPWYVKALALSRPLHFGDYGGIALKCVWAILDLVTIAVLISGLYLWLKRRRPREKATSPGRPIGPGRGEHSERPLPSRS